MLLWTTLTTEQCYWNQSRCIEVVSHVEKTCSPCCSYNWSMAEHIPGLLAELFNFTTCGLWEYACHDSLWSLFSVLGCDGNMHQLLASRLSVWRGGEMEDWARTSSNPHNGACSPLNQVWFLPLRAWGHFLYLSSSVLLHWFLYNWSALVRFLGFFCQLGACVGESKSCKICSSGTKRLLQTTFEEHFKIWQKTGLINIMYSLEVIAGFVV